MWVDEFLAKKYVPKLFQTPFESNFQRSWIESNLKD